MKRKIIFGLLMFIFVFGCSDEKKAEKQKVEELGLGEKVKFEFMRGEDETNCGENAPNVEWLKKDEIKIDLTTNLESRGRTFKETAVYTHDNVIDLYIIEDFCRKNCSSVRREQCSNFLLKNMEPKNYKVNVHLVEELSKGGVIEKFDVAAPVEE